MVSRCGFVTCCTVLRGVWCVKFFGLGGGYLCRAEVTHAANATFALCVFVLMYVFSEVFGVFFFFFFFLHVLFRVREIGSPSLLSFVASPDRHRR